MNEFDIRLNSVNWEHGMLLTPEHFLRLENYFESALLWATRYLGAATGLVGGGARVLADERGGRKHDSVISLEENGDELSLSVAQCRGVTQAGCIIEIRSENALHESFQKPALAGVSTTNVYVVCVPHKTEVLDGSLDE